MQVNDISQLGHQQNHAVTERSPKTAESRSPSSSNQQKIGEEELQKFAASVEKYGANELVKQTKLFYAGSAAIVEDFSAQNTAERLSYFVLSGAGDSEELLKSGKNALFDSAADAQRVWGGNLPEIANNTLVEAIKAIDYQMRTLGFPILSLTA